MRKSGFPELTHFITPKERTHLWNTTHNFWRASPPGGSCTAIPCVISLLVGALYNIVDQIFIANTSYLGSYGNAANTVAFPLTVVALAIAVSTGKAILLQWNKRRWYRYQKGLRQRDVADS